MRQNIILSYIIAFLACTMISCADDMKFPERIEFPAEGGQIKVYSDYNHFKITFRDSNAPIGINDDYTIEHSWLEIKHNSNDNEYVFTAEPNTSKEKREIIIDIFGGDTNYISKVLQYGQ